MCRIIPHVYRRLEARVQGLSRFGYAVVIGFGSFFGVLVVSPLLKEITAVNAAVLGCVLFLVYYT